MAEKAAEMAKRETCPAGEKLCATTQYRYSESFDEKWASTIIARAERHHFAAVPASQGRRQVLLCPV